MVAAVDGRRNVNAKTSRELDITMTARNILMVRFIAKFEPRMKQCFCDCCQQPAAVTNRTVERLTRRKYFCFLAHAHHTAAGTAAEVASTLV